MSKNKLNSNTVKKIIFIGLDNGGKTSIVLSLKGLNLMSLKSSNPTRGIETSNLNINDEKFNIWDFGGQEQYRNIHLENFKNNFQETDKIIYVIDIQDQQRYNLALEYLMKIMKKLGNQIDKIKFSLFLHKFDPNLKETHPDLTDEVIADLITKIKEVIPSYFWDEIYKTSIYTVFERRNI
ncbi:MAG: ADP-ribosylation factor-like protein [Promethearchaeota archaeon]|jgi:ADP-ribosylation factor protein 6